MWVYLNDRFVPEDEAKVSIFDYGFLYGDGLFETLRAYSGNIFALALHLNRLSRSAASMRLPIPSDARLKTLLCETLNKNHLKDAILRLTLTRGRGKAGLHPEKCREGTLVMTARPFEGYTADQHKRGVSGTIVRVRRSTPTGREETIPKSLSFLNNSLAKLEAEEKNVFEGIFLNEDGFLSEGTVSNLFWVQQGILKTPSTAATILKGVTRQIVICLAKKNGWELEEGLFRPKDLFSADEAFLTNTGLELMPLTTLNGKKIGTGQQGFASEKLHQLFQKVVSDGQTSEC